MNKIDDKTSAETDKIDKKLDKTVDKKVDKNEKKESLHDHEKEGAMVVGKVDEKENEVTTASQLQSQTPSNSEERD